MIDFEEQDDEKAKRGEAKAGQEPSSPPFYDPLIAPWDEPSAPAAFRVVEPGDDPAFRAGWATGTEPAQGEEALVWGPAPAWQERHLGAWHPVGYQRPYEDAEGLSELQRRLREGTITVPRPQWRWAVTIREVAETLLLAMLIFLAVRTSFQNFRVEGASMTPSLENGEYLIVNKLAYAEIDLTLFDWLPFYDAGADPIHHLWDAPDRGDIIVFRSPTNVDRDFIKRIIGVPGDTIEIDPGKARVSVNGNVIEEPYIQGTTSCSQKCKWTVPPRSYFVMGDNRQNSSDSRQDWFVPEENIIGKALITYWHEGGPELKLAPNHSVSLASEAAAEE